jgi:amino acid transporter
MTDAPPASAPRLEFFDTTLYAIVATIGIRWLPVAAAIGPASLPLWLLAFFVFYIPLGAAVAELTEHFEGGGSLYGWTRGTFGPLPAFVCGWFYWISLLPYLAGIIYFLSGVILSVVGADAHNGTLYLAVSVAVTVFATGVQLLGLRFGKWLTNLGASGSWLIFTLIIVCAAILLWRHSAATDFLHSSYVPHANFDTAILWGTIVFGLCGTETLAFLRNDIAGGMRTIRRVVVALGVTMVLIYIAGTAAMLVILPQGELTRLGGLTDALHAAFGRVGLPAFAVFALVFFALSQLGGLTAWFGIGARLPMEAGIDNFLPPVFAKRSAKTGAPVPAILLQGGLTLFVVILSQAGEGAAAAYDFLLSMSVLTATIPYVFVFAAYLARKRWPIVTGAWQPPGGARTGRMLGIVGMIATLVAIACTMVPSGTDLHPLATFLKIVFSTLGGLAIGLFLYWLGQRRARQPAIA